MTYKTKPEVIYQCQVIVFRTSERCTRNAEYIHGSVQMCSVHHNIYADHKEQERLRLIDKYEGEQP